jgi:hypothetical protein
VPNALKEFFCLVKWWFKTDRLSNIQAIGGKMKQKSAKLYQFPRHRRTASIPIVHSEESCHNKNDSIKTNKMAWWKRMLPWTYWAGMAIFGPILAFA